MRNLWNLYLVIAYCLVCGVSNGNVLTQCVEENYTSQIGVKETSPNAGKEVKAYLASTNLKEGYAWCAAFVNWCFQECGINTPKQAAWSPSWFPTNRIIYDRMKGYTALPRAGDVFGIYYNSKKRIAHVGFVHTWGNRFVITVEGNTNNNGSREGDGVYLKRRIRKQIYQVARWG